MEELKERGMFLGGSSLVMFQDHCAARDENYLQTGADLGGVASHPFGKSEDAMGWPAACSPALFPGTL